MPVSRTQNHVITAEESNDRLSLAREPLPSHPFLALAGSLTPDPQLLDERGEPSRQLGARLQANASRCRH